MATPSTIASSSNTTRLEWLAAAVRGSRSPVGAAEEQHRAGHTLQHVREVLGAHDRVGHAVDVLGTEHLAGDAERELGEVVVVAGHRIAELDFGFGGGAVRLGDPLGDAAQVVVDLAAGALADGADRSDDRRRLRDDVASRAGDDLADGHDRGVEDVDPARDHQLQRLHDLARDRDRVDRAERLAGMTTGPVHDDLERVGGGHRRPTLGGDGAGRQRRRDVDRERSRHGGRRSIGKRRDVEQAFLEHEPRPALALLAWLEHEQHTTGYLVAAAPTAAWRWRRASRCACHGRRRACGRRRSN